MPQTRRLTPEHEPFLTARSLAAGYPSGYTIAPHRHAWHQLLFASAGAMTVFGGRRSWMVTPGRAVLIPAGIEHSIRMWGEVAMRSLYFPTSSPAAAFELEECRAIPVSPLLRELILRVVELAALDARVGGGAGESPGSAHAGGFARAGGGAFRVAEPG
jgi:mannose-6-phosphate isomerase-like protein (cupin superfamily)